MKAVSYFVLVSALPLDAPADRSQLDRWACLASKGLPRQVLISISAVAFSGAAMLTFVFRTDLKSQFQLNLCPDRRFSSNFVSMLAIS